MLFRKTLYIILLAIMTVSFLGNTPSVYAVGCKPNFTGNWIVEGNCDFPSGNIEVFGDIIVGTRTITVPTGVTLGVNLSVQKVTFTTGKILFEGTGKMQDIASGKRYFETLAYSSNTGITACPSGFRVLNTAGTAIQPGTITVVSTSGNIKCGKI